MQRTQIFNLMIIRILAVMFIFGFHLEASSRLLLQTTIVPHFFTLGYCGVDILFLLSGFLMAKNYLLPDKKKPFQNTARQLLIRRLIKLLPLYWFLTALLIGLYLFLPLIQKPILTLPFILKSFFLLPDQKPPLLGIAWTLRQQMLFYLLLALYLKNKRVGLTINLIIIGGCLFNFFWLVSRNIFVNNPWFNYFFQPLNLEFYLGITACYLTQYLQKNKYQYLCLVLGIILFSASLIFNYLKGDNNYVETYRLIFYGLPIAGIIFSLGSLPPLRIKLAFPWQQINDSSYAIFLSHNFLLSGLLQLGKSLKLLRIDNIFFSAVLTLILCLLLHYFFEQPLYLRLRKRFLPTRNR